MVPATVFTFTAGADIFTVNSLSVLPATGTGVDGVADGDTVFSSVNFDLRSVLGYTIENLSLTGTGNTTGVGSDGNDRMIGNGGNNTLLGAKGDDFLSGGNGDDKLYGNAGNDTLIGGMGADKLYGGGNNDALFGGIGIDLLQGDAGNDYLNGGLGADTLTGGSGADKFAFAFSTEGIDTITDFAIGSDKIMVKGTNFGGIAPASLVTVVATGTAIAGQFSSGATGLFYHDGVSEVQLATVGGQTLTAADFTVV